MSKILEVQHCAVQFLSSANDQIEIRERNLQISREARKMKSWIETVKYILRSMEDGEITISAYDTAWIALVPALNGSAEPQFPSSLQWLIDNQLQDGSWGDPHMFLIRDRVINTLACVLALKTWNTFSLGVNKGLIFLQTYIPKMNDEHDAHTPVGFEIVFPALMEDAKILGLDLPYDAEFLQKIHDEKALKMKRITMKVLHEFPSTLLHSLEGLRDKVEWEKILKLQSKNGSFLFSPASTACALAQTSDTNCLRYLNEITEKYDGGAPNVYPVDLFERLWTVDRIERLGIARYFESEITDSLEYVYRYWTNEGIGWARESPVKDVDDTSMAFRLLRSHGFDVTAEAFNHFKQDDQFFCFFGQTKQTVTGMYNLYRASQLLFPGESILEEAREFTKNFLEEKRAEKQLRDKWIIAKGLKEEVEYALKFPWYASQARIAKKKIMAVNSVMRGPLCVVILILVSLGTSDSMAPIKRSLFHFSPTLKWNTSAATVLASAAEYHVSYYTQILDHFTFVPESYQTFQQRYLINSDHWGGASAKSPIFLYTGNEGFIEWFAQNTGFMFDIAPQFKALLVFIEHRFYGHSMPFGSQRAAYSNSSTHGFLSSAQALADFATLITDLKKNLSAEDSPVVLFGGSYGGMLAAWFRLKYPHIAIGAVSSSAPILFFDNITPPASFDNTVSQDFRSESENCFKVIKDSWNVIDNMTSTAEGLKSLRKALRICESNSDDDIAGNLGGWFSDAYSTAAMTDYPVAANFVQPLPAYPVKQMCKAIDNPSGSTDILNRLYGAANVYYNYTGSSSCFDLQSSDPHGEAGWEFQACTEMVMPMADDPKTSMFPSSTYDYKVFADSCESAYGVQPRRHWITTLYGGHDIKRVLKNFASNIIFFNGLRDPWSGGGVLEDINESVVAIVAKEGAHHVDFRFATKEDPQWLKDIRTKEISIIKMWLQQYYMDLQNS